MCRESGCFGGQWKVWKAEDKDCTSIMSAFATSGTVTSVNQWYFKEVQITQTGVETTLPGSFGGERLNEELP